MPDFVRIGGIQYDWNSTISRIDGTMWRGITSVDWSEKLDVETVYSQTGDGVPIGGTSGQYAVDSFSIKMLMEYWQELRTYLCAMAPGIPPGNRGPFGSFGETTFTFQLSASKALQIGALPIMMSASPCRVISAKQAAAKGNAALEAELGLWCPTLEVNGTTMYSPALPTI